MLQQTLFFSFVYLIYVIISFRFRRKKVCSDADVRWRKWMVNLWSYTFIFHLNAFLVTAHWHGYIRIWGDGKFDPSDLVCLVELLCLVFYFLLRPIRKLVMTVYSADDIARLSDFCLYLRPFSSDAHARNEKCVCRILAKYWRVFAIGNPCSILPNIYAARVFVSDEKWKSVVRDLMSRAHMIAYRIGDTDGARWELEHILPAQMEKTIFVVFNKEEYNLMLSACATICSVPPPDIEWDGNTKRLFHLKKSQNGLVWDTCNLHDTASVHMFVRAIIDDNTLSSRIGLTETGQRRGVGTFLFGKGLMYGRIRSILFFLVAGVITNFAARIGYHVYNEDKYSLHSNKYGYLTINPVHILNDCKIIDSELKISSWSVRPQGDFALAALETDFNHHTILLFNLTKRSFTIPNEYLVSLGNVENLHCINFNWDGNSIVLFCGKSVQVFRFEDENIKFDMKHLDFWTNVEQLPFMSMHKYSGVFCIDGNIAVCGEEGLFVYRDNGQGDMLWHESCKSRYSFRDGAATIDINPKTHEIVYPNGESQLLFLNCQTRERRHRFSVLEKYDNKVRFSPNGSELAVANGGWYPIEGRICVFDVENARDRFNLLGHRAPVFSLEYTPDGEQIVTVSADGTIRIWDATSGKELYRTPTGKMIHESSFECNSVFAVMNISKTEVLAFYNNELRIFKINSQEGGR